MTEELQESVSDVNKTWMTRTAVVVASVTPGTKPLPSAG
jgi:hypothetical protein